MNSKILVQSTKWSAISETVVKLASPIANILLARLLAPEVFGLVATYTLVTSFAELFTDGGFQKYLVQHEFANDAEKERCTNTAFWTNFILSIFFWFIIFIFRNPISQLVGSAGHGVELTVLGLQIPIFSFSSIQQALYRREFRFKELAPIRLLTSLIPLIVTVPLAAIMRNTWAIICGYLIKDTINAILLTRFSNWKPKLIYSITDLKTMLADCLSFMADSIMVWLTAYAGTLIVSNKLTSYYLGVYRTGYTTITAYLSIIFAVTQPVLFSALSRSQNDSAESNRIFIQYLKYVAYLVLPLGMGIFIYHNLVIQILLGSKWLDASIIIALTGLTYPINMLTGQYNSVYFRANGKPLIALLVQTVYVTVMIVVYLWASEQTFEVFCFVAATVNLVYAAISTLAMRIFFQFPILTMLKSWLPSFFGCIAMMITGYLTLELFTEGIVFQILSAVLASFTYFGCLLILPKSRSDIKSIVRIRDKEKIK